MQEIKYIIQDESGIHARPAGALVKEAAKFSSNITISNGEKEADAKKLMAIMMLGIKHGQEIIVKLEGEDEEVAVASVETFLKENL